MLAAGLGAPHFVEPRGAAIDLPVPDRVGRAHSIAIGAGLVDIYGQPYAAGRKLGFVAGPMRFGEWLYADTGMHVLDPRFEIPQWLVSSSAVASMRVQLFAVQPKDYFAYEQLEVRAARDDALRQVERRQALDRRRHAHRRALFFATFGGRARAGVALRVRGAGQARREAELAQQHERDAKRRAAHRDQYGRPGTFSAIEYRLEPAVM